MTAVPGAGCITFEGSDGSRTVTSADVRCKVCANSGTAEGALPAPATSAWEALVRLLGAGGISAEEKQALLAVLRLLAAGNDAAMTAYAVWKRCGAPRSRRRRTFLPRWDGRSLEK